MADACALWLCVRDERKNVSSLNCLVILTTGRLLFWRRAFFFCLSLFLCSAAQPQSPAAKALARVNYHRQMAGVKPVVLDENLSRGCLLHAQYLHRNRHLAETRDLRSHTESSKRPGYTKEGAQAAGASTIHYISDPVRAVDDWMGSFYHRLPLLREGLTSIGFGSAGSIVVLDCNSGWNRPEITPIAYPGVNQINVPLRFVPENPDPVPGQPERAGYPITLQFRPFGQKVTDVRAILSSKGSTIPIHLSHPQKPASSYDQQNAICLIPKRPLAPRQNYLVTIMAQVDGQPFQRKWSFITANR